ncbi:MAG: oligosaccharide flippase family protein [Halieaceae bacterium]
MSRLRRNVIANYIGGAWTALMGFAFMPLYIHYLGIEAFGLIGLYVALQAWMIMLDMGFTPTLNREMARLDAGQRSPRDARSLIRTLELVYLPLTAMFALPLVLLSRWIATEWLQFEQLQIDDVAEALSIIGFTVIARWFSTLYRGAIMGLQHQVWLNGANIFFATIRGPGVLVVLEYFSASLLSFFLFQFVVYVIEALVLRGKLLKWLPAATGVRFSLKQISGVAHFALGVAFINILAGLLTQLDKFVLSATLPLSVLGYYTLASTVAGALYIMIAPVSNAAFPRFTAAYSSGEAAQLAVDYHKLTQACAGIVLPMGLFLSCFAYPVLLLWTGDRVLAMSAAPILSILALGSMLNGVMTLPYTLQLSSGWTRLTLILNTIAVLAYVPVVYPAIAHYGAMAPAFFWLALNVFYVLVAIPLMHRRLLTAERNAWYRQSLLAPLAGAAVVCLGARLLFSIESSAQDLLSLAILVLVLSGTVLSAMLATPLYRNILGGFVLGQPLKPPPPSS